MTDEEKKAAETAEAEAQAKAQAEKEQADADFEAGIADLSDEEKEAKRAEKDANKTDKNNPDYEAELEKERKAREAAEKALADARFKKSEAKRKAEESDDLEDDEDDKPLTKREHREILAGLQSVILKETQSVRIGDIAKRLSSSDSEARLTIEIHKNRQWPSSIPLEQQLEEANAIANRKKLQSVNKELARALQGKDGVSKDSAGTHRDGMQGSAPKMSASDTAAYKNAGFSFNTTNKLWQKKLPNGKLLNKDPRTKRTFIS